MTTKRIAAGRSAEEFLPETKTLPMLRRAAADCQGCDLYQHATQTVFGEGSAHAAIVLVGEQPGDFEDRAGHPFVGPAGNILDRALAASGLPREEMYITNAVKHFKWEQLGRRRKHKRPSSSEIAACRPWLLAELAAIQPKIVVGMGAVAAHSLMGKAVSLTAEGGKFQASSWGPLTFLTLHPSSVLRMPEKEDRDAQYARLVQHLTRIREKLETLTS